MILQIYEKITIVGSNLQCLILAISRIFTWFYVQNARDTHICSILFLIENTVKYFLFVGIKFSLFSWMALPTNLKSHE